uniref:Putative secreted peptide n=1 Tax=Anopheles braziliensis TaxID=58242 RepID=A0A2M3ZW48_9DIPT
MLRFEFKLLRESSLSKVVALLALYVSSSPSCAECIFPIFHQFAYVRGAPPGPSTEIWCIHTKGTFDAKRKIVFHYETAAIALAVAAALLVLCCRVFEEAVLLAPV